MKLDAIAKAIHEDITNHSILIYGPPKSGKTQLVATAAKIPEITKIYWLDLENGYQTLLNMGLTEQEMAKIHIFRIPDTRDNPVAIETMLKLFSAKTPITICNEHGVADCVQCKKLGPDAVEAICLKDCKHTELVVIDSGSQLGDSALNAACKGTEITYKPQLDDYGSCGKWLADILSVIQQAKTTNFVVITHELVDEEEINGVKKDRIFPLMGTKTFSRKVAKYFGTVAYLHMKLGKHTAGSSSTYKAETLTGSRVGAMLEKTKEPSMYDILVTGGIIKSSAPAPASAPSAGVALKSPGLTPSLIRKP